MGSKKFNVIAFIMMAVMCVVSVFACLTNKKDDTNISDDILAIYKKIEKLEDNDGKSAYEIAQDNGFTGTESEWLDSLVGAPGENALSTITPYNIYEAYLDVINKTSSEFSYNDFLVYYYSVADKHDVKTATQMAYSTTVDICYSWTNYTYYMQETTIGGETAYVYSASNSGAKGGVSAGAGVIYQMIDSDDNGSLDTAYIITNYHVAYIENYTNDSNYSLYYNSSRDSYFLGSKFNEETLRETYSGYFSTYKYYLKSDMDILTTDEGISKHFLSGGDTEDYYGIYLYGYQDKDYKLNATFVGGSADNDIAVLKVERENLTTEMAKVFFDSGNYAEVKVGDSSKLVGGEEIIAVGNPLIAKTSDGMTLSQYESAYLDALVLSSTSGVVSVVSDNGLFTSLLDSNQTINMRLIRVDAAINSGNSGGGLYDLYGNLVGIVNSKIASSSYDNVGFAIPINVAVNIAEQVINQCEGESKTSSNTRIKVLKVENLSFTVEKGSSKSSVVKDSNGNNEWNVSYNILVQNIDGDSLAFASGLRNDDIIKSVSFGGKTYDAETYFNLDYELEDLLLKVGLSETTIVFNVTRATGNAVVTITLNSNCFVEIC